MTRSEKTIPPISKFLPTITEAKESSMFRFGKRSVSTVVAVLTIVALTATARAQETIYVGQFNPSEMHAFTFNGTSFTEQTPTPPSSVPPLSPVLGGYFSQCSATTGHFFLMGSAGGGLEFSVVDPFTRQELPRVHSAVFPAAIIPSADQHFAFVPGSVEAGNAWLSVVDILPSSPTFLREVSQLPLLPVPGSSDPVLQSAGSGAQPDGGALSPDGSRLYVSVSGGNLGNDGAVVAVNVSNPLSPSISGGARIPNWLGGNMRYGTIRSVPYLFLLTPFFRPSSVLVLIPILGGANGANFDRPVRLASTSPDTGRARRMADAYVEDGASPKALLASSSRGREEVLTIDLSGPAPSGATATATVDVGAVTALTITNPGSGYPASSSVSLTGGGGTGATATATVDGGGRVTAVAITNGGIGYTSPPTVSFTGQLSDCQNTGSQPPCVLGAALADPAGDGFGLFIAPSLDGQYLYLIEQAGDPFICPPGQLFAFSIPALNSGSPQPASFPVSTLFDSLTACPPDDVSSIDFVAYAVGLSVQNAVTPTSPTPPSITISNATVDQSTIFTNKTSNPLTITGSGLSSVVHVFLGLTELPILPGATSTTLTATIPALIPSGNPALLLVDSSGGLTNFTGQLTVNDPVEYLPKAVVYATGASCNQYSEINSATGSEVVSNFSTITQQSIFAKVTKDGNYLLASGIDGGRLTIHSLLNNNGYGWNKPVETIYAAGDSGYSRFIVQNPAIGRNTVYISNVFDTIYMLDPNKFGPPDPIHPDYPFIDADADPTTPSSDSDAAFMMPTGVSGIPLPLACWSLTISPDGNWLYGGADTEIERIDVSTDKVTADKVTSYPIADLTLGRTAGLAVSSDGTKIFVGSTSESFVRVFSRNPADGSIDTSFYTALSPSSDSWPSGDFRVILAPSNGFLYVTSRGEQRLDIFDVHDLSNITYVTKIVLPLFASVMDITPANDYLFVAAAENDSVTAIYEGPTTPENPPKLTQHQIVTVTGAACGTSGIAVSPGAATPASGPAAPITLTAAPSRAATSNFSGPTESGNRTVSSPGPGSVTVTPTQTSTVIYSDVTTAGNTAVTSTNVSSLTTPPTLEIVGYPPVYYDVSTTASYSGPVNVCLAYDPAGLTLAAQQTVKVLHQQGATFSNVTSSVDTANHVVCGQVSSFSQFVVAQSTIPVGVQAPGGFSTKGIGPLNVTILGSASFVVTQVDPSSLKLLSQGILSTGAPGAKAGTISDVNKDKFKDLTVSFPRSSLRISGSHKSTGTIYLQGRRFDGTAFAGQATVSLN